MLRPNATKIVLTRDDIRHLRGREVSPRLRYHGRLPVALRSDGPAFSPVANLHAVRDLPFRTRPCGPRHAVASSSDETRSIQSTLPANPGQDYEQSSETTTSSVEMQGSRPSPAALQAGRRIREAPQQSPEASEDTNDSWGLPPSARDMHPTPEEVAGSGPDMELSSSDASPPLEFMIPQDHRDGGLFTSKYCPTSSPLTAAIELWASPACQEDSDDTHTPTIRAHHQRNRPVMVANFSAGAAVASRDEYSVPNAEEEPSTDVMPVYNDMLDPSSQPQTPLNLPESRRRNRLDGTSTMFTGGQAPSGARQDAATLTGRRRRRGGSPVGLQTPGFVGLFGGLENADGFTSS